jgi:serine/threonine-protein kinase
LGGSCVGRRFGDYNICFEIACGGMATVYLASTTNPAAPRRFAALKVIHRHLAAEQNFIQMFLDEAMISSMIHHPNVCRVFDFDEVDGHHYLAMEYLVGESLSTLFRRTLRTPPHEALALAERYAAIMADACNGLHAAHELRDSSGTSLNIVHRDISPENIFLTYDGVVKVVDFGLAIAENQTHTTRAGILRGKFGYIAPEVVFGARPDRRADVWSLGVVLWELLTGRRLFRRDSDAETLRAVTDTPIFPASQIRPGLPPELDAIVMRALARNPEERYATARQLGGDLIRFLSRRRAKVGLVDLGEWLTELFPSELRRKRQLLEMAALIRGAETIAAGGGDRANHPASAAMPQALGSSSRAIPLMRELHSKAPKRGRARGLFAALVAVLCAGVAGAAWKTGKLTTLIQTGPDSLAAASTTRQANIVDLRAVSESVAGSPSGRIELAPGKAYVLEVVTDNGSSVVLKIRSENGLEEAKGPTAPH